MSDVSWVQHQHQLSLQRHKQHGQGLGSIITGTRCSPLQPRLGSSQMWSWHTFSLWNRHQGTLTGVTQARGLRRAVQVYSRARCTVRGADYELVLRSVVWFLSSGSEHQLWAGQWEALHLWPRDRRTEWTVRPVTLSEDRPAPGESGEQPMMASDHMWERGEAGTWH